MMVFHGRGTGGREGPIGLCQSPCGWRNVRNDIGTSPSEGDLGAVCKNGGEKESDAISWH